MPYYYQVILKLRSSGPTQQQVLTDASEGDLLAKIVTPYKKGNNIFHESTVFDSNDIEMIKIIRTSETDEVIRDELLNESIRRNNELNRSQILWYLLAPAVDMWRTYLRLEMMSQINT